MHAFVGETDQPMRSEGIAVLSDVTCIDFERRGETTRPLREKTCVLFMRDCCGETTRGIMVVCGPMIFSESLDVDITAWHAHIFMSTVIAIIFGAKHIIFGAKHNNIAAECFVYKRGHAVCVMSGTDCI